MSRLRSTRQQQTRYERASWNHLRHPTRAAVLDRHPEKFLHGRPDLRRGAFCSCRVCRAGARERWEEERALAEERAAEYRADDHDHAFDSWRDDGVGRCWGYS